jgi:hypothetical protein
MTVISNDTSQKEKTLQVDAAKFSFHAYEGKTIKEARYCDNCAPAGDLFIIKFTDGTELKIYAYKYNMKIQK